MNALKGSEWIMRGPAILVFCATGVGSQLPVEIVSVPANADSILLVASANELSSPLSAFTHLARPTPTLTVALPPVPGAQLLNIRAIAFEGTSMFPNVTAIGTSTVRGSQAELARITLTWPKPRVEIVSEIANATTILFTFAATDFFQNGDVAELWISNSIVKRNCSGVHYLAPFLKIRNRGWEAQFVIPTELADRGMSNQLAFHAIDFGVAERIPLLVWPNWDSNEPSLQIMSSQSPRGSFPRSPDQGHLGERPIGELEPDAGGKTPARSYISTPSAYVVKAGSNGKLIRIPLKSNKSLDPADKN